jgi:hypothetical protein
VKRIAARQGVLSPFLVACICLWAGVGQAMVYVDQNATGADDGTSWADAYTDLQTALGAAPAGEEIWIAAGTYKAAAAAGDRNATFALRNGVALYGGFAGHEHTRLARDPDENPTVLSGDLNGDDTPRILNGHNGFQNPSDNSFHVVTAEGTDVSAVLDGVIVTHGYSYVSGGTPAPTYQAGAGLLVVNASPKIRRVKFDLNAAPRGAAVAVYGSTVELVDSAFVDNYADIGTGGGIYVDGSSDVSVARCSFRRNVAIGGQATDGYGGAIYNHVGGKLLVKDSRFVDNFANFRTNSLSDYRTRGGAIASYGTDVTIRDSVFVGNSANLGGAVYAHDVLLVNDLFSGNDAHDQRAVGLSPAGIGGAVAALSDSTVVNTTLSANTSTDNGAGIYTSGAVVVANSIVWGNRVDAFIPPGEDPVPLVKMQIHKGSGSLDILHSDVEGLFETIPGEDPPDPVNFPGSIDADPLFVDPAGADGWIGTEDDDLRLGALSPAIDAGDNAWVPADITLDLDDNRRFADDPTVPDTGAGTPPIVDMGAYEAASIPPPACGLGAELVAILPPLLWLRRRRNTTRS